MKSPTMKSRLAITIFITTLLIALCNNMQAQTKVQTDSIHREMSSLILKNCNTTFLHVSDTLPQHFLFSIRFDLDSKGTISSIKNSANMHWAFEGTPERMYEKVNKELFKQTGYRNVQVIVPVYIFTVEMGTRIRYDTTFEGIEKMWSYEPDQEQVSNAIIFPPVYLATAKGLVTLTTVEDAGHRTIDKVKKDIPIIKNQN